MGRIAFLALVMFLVLVEHSNAFEGLQETSAVAGPEAATALRAADGSTGIRMTPFPEQPVKSRMTTRRARHAESRSKRSYLGRYRECPGYTMSRHARLRVNRTVERLLAQGYDDPLSQPAYLAAASAENAIASAVDRCNMAWIRDHSIYTGKRPY
jgi:hypothetical protein